MIQGYYFITDENLSRKGSVSDVRAAVSAGVKVVQYRNKSASTSVMVREAGSLRKLFRKGLFLINDRVDVALAVYADGVHLGQQDMPYLLARKLLGKKRIIGLTVNNVEQARQAQALGVDYIGVAPIFATATKTDAGTPVGIDGLHKICAAVTIPVVAIGGIDLSNAGSVVAAGAKAYCAISAVLTKSDVAAEIKKFQLSGKS